MTNDRFINQVAIITGAGQGIGFEIARQMAMGGAAVLLNDIDEQLANRAAGIINMLGGKCYPLAGNAADINFIQQMVDTTVSKFGFVTIAIANAGITSYGEFLEYQPEALQRVIDLNIFG